MAHALLSVFPTMMRPLHLTLLAALTFAAAVRPAQARPPTSPFPTAAAAAPRVADTGPSEPGRVFAESAAAFGAAGAALGLAGLTIQAGPVPAGVFLLGPLGAAEAVCAIGSGSDLYEGRCSHAIIGAYVGALVAVPVGFIGFATSSEVDDGGFGRVAATVLAGAIGYTVGTTIGAVVGWNSSLQLRGPRPTADDDAVAVARLDALAATRGADWREPPRRRGPAESSGVALAVPLLALRF